MPVPTGLLLIHAFPLDASMWRPQTDALGTSISTVTPNLPGFGGSLPAGPVTTMDAMADVCASALHADGLDRVVVCGLSMGGYAALAFWRRHRALVAGLVLANTRAGADDDAGKARRAALATRLRQEGSGFFVDNPPPLLSAGAPQALVDRVKQIIAAQPAAAIAAASLGMAARPDATDQLGGIDVPALVMTSSADALIPSPASREMADAIPDAEFRIIAGVGHLSNLEAPEVFNELLREHLARCGALAS